MLLSLWNFLRGYVIIRVSGFSVERFLNLSAVKKLYVWDIQANGSAALLKISISALEDAYLCAKKTGCEIKILKNCGLPFFVERFKGRQLLIIGGFVFVFLFYGFSLFVWNISYSGNKRVSEEELAKFCRENGLYPGGLKLRCDIREISDGIVEGFGDVLWAAIEIRGTKAYVRIVETIEETPIVDRKTPMDIVSDKDGIILSIVTAQGTPMVKKGDAVTKGDILIASEVPISEADEIKGYSYVSASGSIMAKVSYSLEFNVNMKEVKKEYTGEVYKDTSVIIKDTSINIVKPSLSEALYDTYYSDDIRLKMGDYSIPIGIKKHEYRVYKEVQKELNEDEAKHRLDILIDNKIEELTQFGSVVIEIKKEYNLIGDTMYVKADIFVSEKIGVTDTNVRRNAQGGPE